VADSDQDFSLKAVLKSQIYKRAARANESSPCEIHSRAVLAWGSWPEPLSVNLHFVAK